MQPNRSEPGRPTGAGPKAGRVGHHWAGPAQPVVSGLLALVARAGRVSMLDHSATSYRARFSTTAGGAPTGVAWLDGAGSWPAIVRFSRVLGLPEPLPDLLRVAIRLTDAHGPGHHRDFVLTSSSSLAGGRHLLIPTTGYIGQTFSSIVPYLIGGRIRLVGAVALAPPVHDGGTALAEVHVAAGRGQLHIDLTMAAEVGAWRRLGRLAIGKLIEEGGSADIRFDPWRPGPGITPLGPIPAIGRGRAR